MGIATYLWQKERSKAEQATNLSTALADTLHKTRNLLNQEVTKTSQLQTAHTADFIKLKSQDSSIIRLQTEVKANKSRLGNNGSVTDFSNHTTIDTSAKTKVTSRDTTKRGDTVYIYPQYTSDVNLGKWITSHIIANKDDTYLKLSVFNDYTVVLGEETNKKGLFHIFDTKIPFVEVTNLNPYSSTNTLKSYQVTNGIQPKSWGIGIQIGYGGQLSKGIINTGPYIGLGISKNLIRW